MPLKGNKLEVELYENQNKIQKRVNQSLRNVYIANRKGIKKQ